jgi:hypothetical protein
MNAKLASLVVFAVAISLVGNAYAHKGQVIGDYKVEVGWVKEPPVAGKANAIEVNIVEASTSEKKSASDHEGHDTKSDKKTKHAHDEKKTTKKKSSHTHSEKSADKKAKHTHDHKSSGIKGLAKSLELDITLNDKKTALKVVEDKKQPGRYTAKYTPDAEGHPTVHIYAKIKTSEIEGTFHPEKVEAQ